MKILTGSDAADKEGKRSGGATFFSVNALADLRRWMLPLISVKPYFYKMSFILPLNAKTVLYYPASTSLKKLTQFSAS